MDIKYYFEDCIIRNNNPWKKSTMPLSYLYGSADRYTVLRVYIMCQYAML